MVPSEERREQRLVVMELLVRETVGGRNNLQSADGKADLINDDTFARRQVRYTFS